MSVTMNTTKSMERTSTVLSGKCGQTIREMKRMMAEAGCAQYESEKITIPNIPGCKDDVVFVGLNGVGFHFLRGQEIDMPKPLGEILRNTGTI